MMIKWWEHFKTINKHKFTVMKHCFKVGLYKQGLLHDLSKYSWTEFSVGAKYYQGNRSPNDAEREDKGYTTSWLHHKGRNKHHYEYWYDYAAPEQTPVIPYKYVVEMICDTLAAGMVYKGKEWTNSSQKEYWERTQHLVKVHPKIFNLLTEVYDEVAKKGIKEVIKPKVLENLYEKHTK